MHSRTEKKLVYYIAFFIALIFNIYKLMALREGTLLAQYWHFNAYELLFEFAWNFSFCIAVAFLNFRLIKVPAGPVIQIIILFLANLFLFIIVDASGIAVQKKLFLNPTPIIIFISGYSLRIIASLVLMSVLVKILLLMRENNAKDAVNEQLRSAYLNAQLGLLKEELNPHFFFNALSSLSAIINENPKQAQVYIKHLSRIFRYTLNRNEKNLVPLADELEVFKSYSAVLKMRLEDGLLINIDVPPQYMVCQLPYMSLQPLLENITKHNAASFDKPLCVNASIKDNYFIMENSLQPLRTKPDSTGLGLSNLNERFHILLKKEVLIEKTDTSFIVKLPLLPA